MHKSLLFLFLLTLASCLAFLAGHFYPSLDQKLVTPKLLTQKESPKELPLLQYSIPALAQKVTLETKPKTPLEVKKIINHDLEKNLYTLLFIYQSQGKTISGALTVEIDETNSNEERPIILMLRGYAPLEIYYSGIGTRSAAAALAEAGYLTLAPDFLGFGESDPEPSDTWEARFIKPLNVIDLLHTLREFPEIDLSQLPDAPVEKISLDPNRIGIWAHSNGGQIALTTLEILGQNLPTTLWAPVLAPFPYSILYFSDEYEDEGKQTRKYIALFEEDYDVFDFSLTRHLDRLHGPIQIHHGGRDDAALLSWTEEFLTKVNLENELRESQESEATASSQSASSASEKEPIEIDFYPYPSADHNLRPNWQQVMQRDLEFFGKHLLAE